MLDQKGERSFSHKGDQQKVLFQAEGLSEAHDSGIRNPPSETHSRASPARFAFVVFFPSIFLGLAASIFTITIRI